MMVDANGATVASYTYDPYGNILTATGSMAEINPLRYRGYYYDEETGFYYLQSRYYDPAIGRFINADDVSMLGADGSMLSYNLFAYCENNPVMGCDPTGYWDWGGVTVGLGIIAVTVITVATCGIGTPIAALVAAAALTTGAVTTYAAATDATMAVDLSYSVQTPGSVYGKVGVSMVIDFDRDESNIYFHGGGGYGYSSGVSYSVGIVSNYEEPNDYAGHFADVSAGFDLGIDHCWTPQDGIVDSTQATCVTFSPGISYCIGYDYYSQPIFVSAW